MTCWEPSEPCPCQAPKPDRHPNSARFHAILAELAELHDRKQADYGRGDDPFANVRASEGWGVPGWVGSMVRASDKVRRLEAFVRNGRLSNEGVDDSLRDLAVYAIIALVLFEEGVPVNEAPAPAARDEPDEVPKRDDPPGGAMRARLLAEHTA